MSLLSKSLILLATLASMTAAVSHLAFADASTVPAYPCYKCVGNGVVTNPTGLASI